MRSTLLIAVVLALAGTAHARRLSPRGQAQRHTLVQKIHRTTGYLLHDQGPQPNPRDRKGWSHREVRRMDRLLRALPAQLKAPGQTRYITRDAMSQPEQLGLQNAEARLKRELSNKHSFRDRLALRGQLAVVKTFKALKMGTAFGHAYRDRAEIRLYNELLRGSSLPGLRKMLAFTTVHELGHRQLFTDPNLRIDWSNHYYNKGGQREYAGWCGYAAGSVDEGYGVGIGIFAVAPKLLKKKSPGTYAFFVEQFGKDAFKKLRGGPTERWAIQATYGLGDMIGRR